VQLGHGEHTVGKWHRRFATHRLEGLSDEFRSGRPRRVGDEKVAEVIKLTLETTPHSLPPWSSPVHDERPWG
jgi:putative transposase